MKWSVSPDCSVPARSSPWPPSDPCRKDETVTPESTATAEPPSVNVLVVPDGVTTGAANATLTLSAADLLVSALSSATIEIARVVVFGAGGGERDRLQGRLVLGRRSAAAQGQHAAGVAAGDAVLVGEVERVARLQRACEIVTVAPVRSVSLEVTVTPESTATAAPPTVNVSVVPERSDLRRSGRSRRRRDLNRDGAANELLIPTGVSEVADEDLQQRRCQ